jgi:hypothetical protein
MNNYCWSSTNQTSLDPWGRWKSKVVEEGKYHLIISIKILTDKYILMNGIFWPTEELYIFSTILLYCCKSFGSCRIYRHGNKVSNIKKKLWYWHIFMTLSPPTFLVPYFIIRNYIINSIIPRGSTFSRRVSLGGLFFFDNLSWANNNFIYHLH